MVSTKNNTLNTTTTHTIAAIAIQDIYVSTVYVLLTFAFAELLRLPCRRFLETNGLIQKCYLEFITTFELCAVCYELGLICDKYGSFAYAIYLFLATIWWEYRWDVPACPYIHVELWLDGTIDIFSGVLLIISEVIGGCMFYRYWLKYLWAMEYGVAHVGRIHSQQKCISDIQVYYWIAAIIEGMAVCLCRLISRMVSEMDPKLGGIINAFVGTGLVVMAMSTSGGYFNPALATALQYGCSGATVFEHLSVYWVGDTIGAILAYSIWQFSIVRDLFITKPKED